MIMLDIQSFVLSGLALAAAAGFAAAAAAAAAADASAVDDAAAAEHCGSPQCSPQGSPLPNCRVAE
eukprot:12140570-Heterocapsa_arctica.AAC.1